jgi:magnesium chelatase accessory protein
MMANWDLLPLLHDLPRLRPALVLMVGGADRTIPPAQAERIRARLPAARIVTLPGLGHLAHEEQPGQVASLLTQLHEEGSDAEIGSPSMSILPYSRAG